MKYLPIALLLMVATTAQAESHVVGSTGGNGKFHDHEHTLDQHASTCINMHQHASTCINKHNKTDY